MPVAAPVIGAGVSMLATKLTKPKAQTQTQTQTTAAPEYLQPYLNGAAQQANQLYNNGGPQFYQGSSVAPLSGLTRTALQGFERRATEGSPLISQASDFVSRGLSGAPSSSFGSAVNPYANPVGYQTVSGYGAAQNPYLDAVYSKAVGQSMNALDSAFARGGRNLHASLPVAGDITTDLAAKIYAPAYETERNRGFQASLANQSAGLQAGLAGQQIGAAGYEQGQNRSLADLTAQRSIQQGLLGFASPLAAQDYLDLSQLQQAGSVYDTHNQAQLTDAVGVFNRNALLPYQNFDDYLARLKLIQGNQGTVTGSGSTSAPSPNYLAVGLGGAVLGQQVADNGWKGLFS